MPRPSNAKEVNPQSFNPTPCQMRALVLDYLCHQGYIQTARTFARDSTVRQIDADGDDIMQSAKGLESASGEISPALLNQVQIRKEIRTCILSGRVDDAKSLLHAHFPSVLSMAEHPVPLRSPDSVGMSYIAPTSVDPAHLDLNLHVLAFTESCRTIPLPYPPTDTPITQATSPHGSDDPKSPEEQTALLKSAQKLYVRVNQLPNPDHRETFKKELANVSGLLAYKIPEESSMARYLSQERREAVADQINTAILYRTGLPIISYVELRARQAAAVWSLLSKYNVKLRPGVPSPSNGGAPSTKPAGNKEPLEVATPFHLHTFLDSNP